MDRDVAQAVAPEQLHVGGADRRRCEREPHGVVAQSAGARVEVGVAVVVLGVPGQLFWCALVTEVVGVRPASVEALVRRRDDGGE
jgi:hypothetical protein